MKPVCVFTIVFLLFGLFSVSAQDLIVLRDGNVIEARVIEISPTEIRYRRFDHVDGPVIVVPSTNVLTIRFENGTIEIINTVSAVEQETEIRSTAMDTDRLKFGFNANPAGAVLEGASVCFELTKGAFNTEIILIMPPLGPYYTGGFGGLITLNYFWHSRIGGVYLGGGFGYINTQLHLTNHRDIDNIFTFGLNAGYKFVTRSGMYFRTGGFIGLSFYSYYSMDYSLNILLDSEGSGTYFYFKPDLTVGWTMR